MRSLQFIIPKQIIQYNKVSRKGGTLTVQGTNLLSVTEILLNNYPVDVWVKVSDTLLLIEIPDFLQGVTIQNVSLYGKAINLSTAVLSAELNDKPIEGFQKLIQRWVKYLLQAPNSNVFTPGGGGLLDMVGRTTTDGGANIYSRVVDAVNVTNTLIFNEQTNQLLPLAEKLLGATIIGITTPSPDEIIVSIKITNQAGSATEFSINI
jgi:hypothetical protein